MYCLAHFPFQHFLGEVTMKSYRTVGLAVVLLSSFSAAVHAAIIVNGGFDSKDNWDFPSGQSGTTSTDGAPESPSAYVAPGGYSIDQTTSHVIAFAETYNVSYWTALSYDDGNGGATKVTLAYDNSGTLIDIAGASQSLTLTTLQDWRLHQFSFTAQAGQDYIGKSLGIKLVNTGGSGWVGFDTVAIATPEPGTLTMILLGIIGIAVYGWRKSR